LPNVFERPLATPTYGTLKQENGGKKQKPSHAPTSKQRHDSAEQRTTGIEARLATIEARLAAFEAKGVTEPEKQAGQ